MNAKQTNDPQYRIIGTPKKLTNLQDWITTTLKEPKSRIRMHNLLYVQKPYT